MDRFIVQGGRSLHGQVPVHGSKNAALPILIATLLTDQDCVIDNVPRLRDIATTLRLLEILGKRVIFSGSSVHVAPGPLYDKAPYDLVKQMRASVLVAGPLLARLGRVRVALPGGCAIGLRPVDIHLKGLQDLGATVHARQGDILITAAKLRAARIWLRFPSVGATEHLMMTASMIPGRTVIENAAREPEISDLAEFLNGMGARIQGAGGSRISIYGERKLGGARHRVMPDRIESGTFLIACAAVGGDVCVAGARLEHLKAVVEALRKAGAKVRREAHGLRIQAQGRPKAVSIRTQPYPGFPTDLQAPWMAYMSLARGRCRIREEIFERRFLHAAELARMGASIEGHGDVATVRGVPRLHGAPVMASDLRAGAALVVAALAAQGESQIQRVYHIDRGYERLEARLRSLGARIRRVRA